MGPISAVHEISSKEKFSAEPGIEPLTSELGNSTSPGKSKGKTPPQVPNLKIVVTLRLALRHF